MGKSKLVRISNRGAFPRWRLESVGSTSKRDKMDDASQGGWFGSGTKIAPIAALALKMEVWISSTDAHGPYLVTYEVDKEGPGGKDDPRVVRVYHTLMLERKVTEFSPGAFINWSKPIGDDDKKEFRVWREYFRNAKDADPEAPYVTDAAFAAQAAEGMTTVFLTRTAEFEAIMRDVNRYFKYLSTDAPIFICKGVGQFWPKSEAAATRMFSQGTLAFCNRQFTWMTLFDYGFDNKELMSEERTFENMTKVYFELARMLVSVPSSDLAYDLLTAVIDGKADIERIALGQVGPKWEIPAAALWKKAWERLYGKDAVIAVGSWIDEYARMSFKRKPVTVHHGTLRTFLKLCGVQASIDVLPIGDRLGYRLIEPQGDEKAILDEARRILIRRYPAMKDVPVHVFEPLTKETDQGYLGFVLPVDPPYTDVYIKRRQLQDPDGTLGMRGRLLQALRTLGHEYRHIRSGAPDGTPELVKMADADEAEMLLDLQECEDEHCEIIWDDDTEET